MMAKSGGGAATAGGIDYQNRVAAWVATHILAEQNAAPPWDLPTETTLEWFQCEAQQPVDDLIVGTSAEGVIFTQSKRNLRLSAAENSDFASTFDQFVRQFIACSHKTGGDRPCDRPLDPERDRLVLITSSASSGPVRSLPILFQKLRNVPTTQPIDSADLNIDEHKSVSVIKKHISRSWQKTLGTAFSGDDLRRLLSLIRIHVLDVETGMEGERTARNLLRSSVLRQAEDDKKAWSYLISQCADLAAKRSGADCAELQRALLDAGFDLKSPPSYQDDIKKLKDYAEATFDALKNLSQIRIGPNTIKINRESSKALQQAVEENSLLVVGEPGSGKSGTLHDLVAAVKSKRRDFVFLAVDRLAAVSPGELRDELGLRHELIEVLDNWPGLKPAFLIIDALDAAREDRAGKMIREIIARLVERSGRWHVVASIRKFDLRYGEETKNLFLGTPPTKFQDSEFSKYRHLNILPLSQEEIDQIAQQSAELYSLIQGAPSELQTLLRSPFNLMLVAELLGADVAQDELRPITTQLELLDRYWKRRVLRSDGQADAREVVLREVCEKMVAERKLRVDRFLIARTENSTILKDLLSTQILNEWQSSLSARIQRNILVFSHHVLFDYAVERLLLPSDTDRFFLRLIDDPDLIIVIRPSILFYFRHLWTVDDERSQFWTLVFRIIQEEKIPDIGKLIGPSVAAELAKTLEDLAPLTQALLDQDEREIGSAEEAIRHIFGALLAENSYENQLVGTDAGPWCQFIEFISRTIRPSTAYHIANLIFAICQSPDNLTNDQRTAAGKTARRLAEFVWARTERDPWIVARALQCVCRTYESDPISMASIIRRCLEPNHLSAYGFEEMPWLAREVKRLIPLDAELVEEIYHVVFEHQESSVEVTPIGRSRILSMTSNRKQDYSMALYELEKGYSAFLDCASVHATRALIRIMESYVAEQHSLSSEEIIEETFGFDGQELRLYKDYSRIWDTGDLHYNDVPIKMLDTFEDYLKKLAEIESERETLVEIKRVLLSENRLAVIWRRVLKVAALRPNTLGLEILPFAWAIPVLTCYDTTIRAGKFIKAVFPIVSNQDRERIERAILSIPETLPPDRLEAAEYERNRLLGCLMDNELTTREANQLLEQLKAENAIPPNDVPIDSRSGSEPYREEEFLKSQGVPVEEEANRRIRDFEQPVKELADKHLNSKPTMEEVSSIFSSLQALCDALSRSEQEGVHPSIGDQAWSTLASACAVISKMEGLSCESPTGSFVKRVLLEASFNAKPAHNPEYDTQFDEHPSWGPAPRIEAAEGLTLLAHNPDCVTPDLIKAIERLSHDPVPAVRYHVARTASALYQTLPEVMWRLLEKMSREEPSRGVLQGLLIGPFDQLAGAEPDSIFEMTKIIFDRVLSGPGAKRVRNICVSHVTRLYIWKNHEKCGEVVFEIAANPSFFRDEISTIPTHLREPLSYGPVRSSDPLHDGIRQRSIDLFTKILFSARACWLQICNENKDIAFNDWSSQDQETAKSVAHLIDHMGSEFFFASGAFDRKKTDQLDSSPLRPDEQAKRFYGETASIMDILAEVGFPSVTHHLLEVLEFFIPLSPREVFLRIGRVVRANESEGYQFESLAANLIVKIVERFLAEYREIFQEDEECWQSLIKILDIFVRAGWPNARQLTYRLEDIFR